MLPQKGTAAIDKEIYNTSPFTMNLKYSWNSSSIRDKGRDPRFQGAIKDKRKRVEKKEVEEKKQKYISAYKGKDEWLKTLEYEEAVKQKWKWTDENDSREKTQNKKITNTCLNSLERRTQITENIYLEC